MNARLQWWRPSREAAAVWISSLSLNLSHMRSGGLRSTTLIRSMCIWCKLGCNSNKHSLAKNIRNAVTTTKQTKEQETINSKPEGSGAWKLTRNSYTVSFSIKDPESSITLDQYGYTFSKNVNHRRDSAVQNRYLRFGHKTQLDKKVSIRYWRPIRTSEFWGARYPCDVVKKNQVVAISTQCHWIRSRMRNKNKLVLLNSLAVFHRMSANLVHFDIHTRFARMVEIVTNHRKQCWN